LAQNGPLTSEHNGSLEAKNLCILDPGRMWNAENPLAVALPTVPRFGTMAQCIRESGIIDYNRTVG